MQYTIRNVPKTLDEALRRAAREQDKSLNEVAIEALARGIPGARFECLTGASHGVTIHDPGRINDLLSKHFARV